MFTLNCTVVHLVWWPSQFFRCQGHLQGAWARR